MKLIFAYVKSYKNIHDQEFSLSDDYDVSFVGNRLHIRPTGLEEVKSILYGGNLIKDLHLIVGRTGAGKTNLLQLIGMLFNERCFCESDDAYFLLYKCQDADDSFTVEVFNMFIPQLGQGLRMHFRGKPIPKTGFWSFRYNLGNGAMSGAHPVEEDRRIETAIVNTFDKNAFADYPYHDIIEPERGNWILRKVTTYGETYPASIINAAKEYVEQMPEDSIKRDASFVINRENWQHKLNVELPRELEENEYWQYGERRQDGIVKSLADIPYASIYNGRLKKGRKAKGKTAKEMFLHDLLTDYAIYLRKVASSVESLSKELSTLRPVHKIDDVKDPTVLPDGNEMPLEQRISWLGQYIDYHTDETNGNKGLVWQETTDILDIISILGQFDDDCFTPDQFSYYLEDIEEGDKLFNDLFERMGQYHKDQYEVFPTELLPYTLTHLSSGEFQYAKIWGALQEAIETQLASGNDHGRPKSIVDLQLIVLMDEPETYLHPEYCREFIYRTVKVLERRNPGLQLQLIVSTHSPFMLSDTISSQVTRIDYDEDGECVVYETSKKPFFAANLFSIMADGFFLDYTIGEYARRYLGEQYGFLRGLVDKHPDITPDEYERVNQIKLILPYIGDEMIRHSFMLILRFLGYA